MAKWCLIRRSEACRHLLPALLLDMWKEQHGLGFHSCFPFFPLAWGRGDGNSGKFTVIEPRGWLDLRNVPARKDEVWHWLWTEACWASWCCWTPCPCSRRSRLQMKLVSLLSVKCQSLVICCNEFSSSSAQYIQTTGRRTWLSVWGAAGTRALAEPQYCHQCKPSSQKV